MKKALQTNKSSFIIFSYCLFFTFTLGTMSCSKEDGLKGKTDRDTALIQDLADNLDPLSTSNPLDWTDSELTFLDKVANAQIVGVGEATHGTKEFFEAKHRIFQYLVENHGYKVFAIEADVGESIYLNEAIQEGRTEDIRGIMNQRMFFWTWHTEEVLVLLEWMSEYNKGKSAADKLQYVGFDCQFNRWNRDLVLNYLADKSPRLHEKTYNLLEVINEQTTNLYQDSILTFQEIDGYLTDMDKLIEVFDKEKDMLVMASTEKEFALHRRLLEVIKQAFETVSAYQSNEGIRVRDGYMADNVEWYVEYFDQEKVFVWAHNFHVSRSGQGPTMGKNLERKFGAAYQVIGFTYTRGEFTANAQGQGLVTHKIEEEPDYLTMNYFLTKVNQPVYVIDLNDLTNVSDNWKSFFGTKTNLTYFNMGSTYNGTTYYSPFFKSHYDYLIHFEDTNFSVQMNR